MKGAIFRLLEDFVDTTFGPDAFDELVESTELETVEPFVGPGNYPPGDLLALVAAAVAAHDTTLEQFLRAFGRHAFPSLARSVPTLMEGLDTPRAFLGGLESMIHTEVRKLDPEADPARFTVTDVDEGSILLHYRSPFGLFPLVEGFLDGIGDWYETPLDHELVEVEQTNGTFLVRFPDHAMTGSIAVVDAVRS